MAILPSMTTGFLRALADAENGHLGRVDDRREIAAADAALIGNGKACRPAILQWQFFFAGFFQ